MIRCNRSKVVSPNLQDHLQLKTGFLGWLWLAIADCKHSEKLIPPTFASLPLPFLNRWDASRPEFGHCNDALWFINRFFSAETLLQSLASALGQSILQCGSTWEVGMAYGSKWSQNCLSFQTLSDTSDLQNWIRHFWLRQLLENRNIWKYLKTIPNPICSNML